MRISRHNSAAIWNGCVEYLGYLFINTGCRSVGHCYTIVRIRKASIDRLIKENDVEMTIPGIRIVADVDFETIFVDRARS